VRDVPGVQLLERDAEDVPLDGVDVSIEELE
jgi:hypothetical protein